MRSLFWKIFLWFWLAMAMVAVTFSAIVFFTQQQRFRERENNRAFNGGPRRPEERIARQALALHLQTVAHLVAHKGQAGVQAYVRHLPPGAMNGTFCFDEQGAPLWRTSVSNIEQPPEIATTLSALVQRAAQNTGLETASSGPYLLAAQKMAAPDDTLRNSSRKPLILAAAWNMRFDEPPFANRPDGRNGLNGRNGPDGRDGPDGPFRRRPPFGGPFGFFWGFFFAEPSTGIQALRLLVILSTTGLVCYGLVRHLTTPIFQLRSATKRLAEGDLSARVAPDLGHRHDELGVLGRDFDQMAERLEALVTSQNRLIADISHELRSPLARVNVALELVRSTAGPEAEEDLDRIALETERLNTMIGQLLTLSRLESGEPLAEKTPVDLRNLIEGVTNDADFEARSHHRFVKVLHASDGQTRGSETLLRSAIENVVRNAVRYTKENSTVEISLDQSEGFALICVRDYGPGVPEEALPHLFQPFYRITDARERTGGGTGLGLSIAERAVRFHGGTIEASNELDDKNEVAGLLMQIRLPLG